MNPSLSKKEKKLVKKAVKKHRIIYKIPYKKNLHSCFTYYNGKLILWYNTIDHSTHIVKE